ncbi:MAG: UDP-N-acetylmuramoyl-tripeptide--D-alanyl-D-alanine ligase [Rikenellaceae bacterium]
MNKIPYSTFASHPKISTDSRNIADDSIFFALHGASFNGNLFAISALEAGAAYAVIDDESLLERHPDRRENLILVEDTLKALQELAHEHRERLAIPIIAITGSNGKTTTKELLHAALSKKYRCAATRGNFNNHIGVPLTLLEIPRDTEIAIVEMGASAPCEIALLSEIAAPNMGVITNIGRAHLEGFGGEDGVAKGKGELLDYLLKSGGLAFIPTDDQMLSSMADKREELNRVDYSYSLSEGVKHHLVGSYNLKNIATAMAIALHLGVELKDIDSAIYEYRPTNNRSQYHKSESNTIIVDCYNANPSSMQASISNFAKDGGKVLILGQMLELGEWSRSEHERVLKQALAIDGSRVILVGQEFSFATESDRVSYFPTRDLLATELMESPIIGAKILVKGSNSVGLKDIIELL